MMFYHLAQMLSHFCQCPISTCRTRQRVEQQKSKLTQPNYIEEMYHPVLFVIMLPQYYVKLFCVGSEKPFTDDIHHPAAAYLVRHLGLRSSLPARRIE